MCLCWIRSVVFYCGVCTAGAPQGRSNANLSPVCPAGPLGERCEQEVWWTSGLWYWWGREGEGRCLAGPLGPVSDVPRRGSRQEVWVRPAGPLGSVSDAGLPRKASRREIVDADSSPWTRRGLLVGDCRLRTRMRLLCYARQNARQDADGQRKRMAPRRATRRLTTTNARQDGMRFADRCREMLGNTGGWEGGGQMRGNPQIVERDNAGQHPRQDAGSGCHHAPRGRGTVGGGHAQKTGRRLRWCMTQLKSAGPLFVRRVRTWPCESTAAVYGKQVVFKVTAQTVATSCQQTVECCMSSSKQRWDR